MSTSDADPAGSGHDETIQRALRALHQGRDLAIDDAQAVFSRVITGAVSERDVESLLLALRHKGESAEEIAGAAGALRRAMVLVTHREPDSLVDTCGTGGGTITTINISTAAAFVAAGAGVPIAKHGNRSFTSRSGSADVLEALGVAIDLPPVRAAEVLAQYGIVFLFAPTYHPAMRHVAPVRRRLAVPTIMNLLGPLANPAGARRQVLGVADRERGRVMADALARLGALHALVVHGVSGVDEIAPAGPSMMWEVRDGTVREWMLDPADYQLSAGSLEGLAGGEPSENATAIERLFRDPEHASAALRAAVVLNAAAAIFVSGLVPSFDDAVDVARGALLSGRASERLEVLRNVRANR